MVKHTQTIRWHFVGFALKGLTSRRELFSQKAPSQMFDRIVNTSLSRANCKKKGKLWDSSLAFREVLASTEWKVSKYGVFSGPYFPVFSPGAGKCRPGKTPYLDTFHALEYPSTYFHWTLMLVLTCQSLSFKTVRKISKLIFIWRWSELPLFVPLFVGFAVGNQKVTCYLGIYLGYCFTYKKNKLFLYIFCELS